LACLLHRLAFKWLLKLVHLAFFAVPIVLLVLGIMGEYNFFEEFRDENYGKYTETVTVDGEQTVVDISSDTRTFIYQEVILSAIKNDYVWLGRTPARGNDSDSYGEDSFDLTNKYERNKNEVCFPNYFTWIGLIGMVLYCLIYVWASTLAVYRSNNVYIRLMGIVVAFHFLFGWMEDCMDFYILNLSLWMMIAMAYSKRFRDMSDAEFKGWVKGIFKRR